MPELKTLPCPLCGDAPIVNADSGHVICCKIVVDNVDAWNSLPRRPDYNDVDCAGCPERRRSAPTWGEEPPKVPGWYWRKETAKDRTHVFHFTGNWEDYGEHWESDRVCPLPLKLNGNLWAGPIPTPPEPEEL